MINLKVTDALFELLRTVVAEKKELSKSSADILRSNLALIYDISKRNDMAHLVGFALEKHGLISPEDETFAKFQKQQYLAIYRCEGMEYEVARMREAFEGNGIDFVFLKGAVIRGLYPEGWMRTSSDIDVLVRRESLEKADKVFTERLGYKRATEGAHDRSFFSEGGVHIELHFSLVEDNRANRASHVLKDVWSYASKHDPAKYEHRLSDGMFCFYHIAHLAKHMENSGLGMRFFVDLWLINRHMNSHEAAELLTQGKLERFAQLCDELSVYWMEGGELSEDAQSLELFVINCGIYGSEENRIAIDRKKNGGTMGYIFRRLFMPYDLLKQSHSSLRKHKWLLPFFQIARWTKLITGKKTRQALKEIKVSSSVKQDDIDEMQAFLARIGLNEK